jgi:hypothetical protein
MFFEKEFEKNQLELPKGHAAVNEHDIEMCPFLKNSKNTQEETSGGGCPVMQVSEEKKNPALSPVTLGYE